MNARTHYYEIFPPHEIQPWKYLVYDDEFMRTFWRKKEKKSQRIFYKKLLQGNNQQWKKSLWRYIALFFHD